MDRLPNERAEKSMSIFEDYVKRVRDLLASVNAILTDEEIARVEHLIDHGECPEALRALAWIIVEGGKKVRRETVDAIRILCGGLIADEHMPDDIESHIID